MALKSKHFDMRLTPGMNRALEELAELEGSTKTDFLVNHIRKQARKHRVKTR